MYCKLIISFICIYITWSILENIVHKYIMHGLPGSMVTQRHRLHHSSTKGDYSLNKSRKMYKELGDDEALCLSGIEAIIMYTVGIFILVPLCLYMLNVPFKSKYSFYCFIFSVILSIYTYVTWNTIHPIIHNEDPFKCGKLVITSPSILNSKLYTWLINNHKSHHSYKGEKKGNYNITLPGADFIFGTYNMLPS